MEDKAQIPGGVTSSHGLQQKYRVSGLSQIVTPNLTLTTGEATKVKLHNK